MPTENDTTAVDRFDSMPIFDDHSIAVADDFRLKLNNQIDEFAQLSAHELNELFDALLSEI